MKQLPGQQRPRWLQHLAAFVITVVATIWMVALLPVLLLVGLVVALLLFPVLRQLRRELEQLEKSQGQDVPWSEASMRNATPWWQRLRNRWR